MKVLLFALVLCAGLQAQTSPLNFYLANSNGQATAAFPSSYSFPDTPAGSFSVVNILMVNGSTSTVEVSSIGFVNGSQQNSYFTSDLGYGIALPPNGSQFFHVYFVPVVQGSTTASMQIGINSNTVVTFSVAQGNGIAAQLPLSCNNSSVLLCNGSTLQPKLSQPINFGNILTTSSLAVTFTLTNDGSSSINPQQMVSLVTATNNPSTPFQLGSLPATIAPGSSGTFTVTFAPGSTGAQQVTLMVGQNPYLLQGTGTASVLGDISSLVITYTDSSGVNLTVQAGSAINFGTTVTGTGVNPVLLFTITNPATTINAVAVPSISVSGAGFAISGTNPAPITIQPGASTTFSAMFSPSATGKYTGTLLIGSRSFTLSGQSITSSLPAPSITVDQQPLLSQQQAHVTVQLAGPASAAEIGTLTIQFAPLVANVSDDPAIEFVATSGRQLQVNVANGAQVATYNGQSAITFQTGTTAGTITFTVQFPNQAAVTQTYTIAPSQVQITSGSAVIQSPNLVVTLTGYDNTYSAGQLSFTFYDTSGKLLTPTAISVNATSAFHQYFFGESQVGGAFSLQASFPVSGDPTQVGSVAITVNNSAGQTSTTQSFQ